MKLQIKKASTDVSIYVFIQDSSSTTGAGLTGLVYNSAGLTCYYVRPLGSATQLTLATLAAVNSAHSDGGFKEVDATNMPGVYRLDLSDAIIATGVNSVVVMLKGATNMAQLVLEIELVAYDPQSATDLGLSRIDAAVSSRASQTSLDTLDDYVDTEVAAIKAKTDQLTFTTANRVDSTVVDKTGFSLSAAGIQAIWDALTTALTAVGSIGKLLVDNINATISSRASQTSLDTLDDYVDSEVAAIKAKTDQLTFTVANQVDSNALSGGGGLDAAGVRAAVGLASANLDTQLSTIDDFLDTEIAAIKAKTDNLPASPAATGDIPSAATIADAVWDEDIVAAHTTADTAGKLLNDVEATVDTEIAAIKAKTDNLPSDPADASDIASSFSTVNTKLDAIDDYVDTEIAAVKTVVDAIKLQTDKLPDGVKKNTALASFMFVMIDATDDVSGKTGLTVTATRSIDGAAFGACTNAVSEVSDGVYKIDLSADDLNGDVITLKFTATGANATIITIKTEE